MVQTTQSIQIKYLKKSHVEQLNEQAVIGGRKNTVGQAIVSKMRESQLFPIQAHHLVVDDVMTVKFVLNKKGDTASLDITKNDWAAIPQKTIDKLV